MQMNSFLLKPLRIGKRVAAKLKEKYFPNEHQKALRKWWQDGGDYALRFNYNLDENSIVLDLGGYEGQWASDLYSRYRSKIHIFEPVPEFSKKIAERFKANPDIKVYSFGLSDSDGEMKIYLQGVSSTFYAKSNNYEIVRTVDINNWLENTLSDKVIDLIKINIEGGEYHVLPRLINSGKIKKFKNIQVQFHNIDKNSVDLMKKIQSSLSETHSPTYQYTFVWENWVLR